MTEGLNELCDRRMVLDWNPLNILNSKYHSFIESMEKNGNEHEETEQKCRDVLLELELYKFKMRSCEGSSKRIEKEMEFAEEEAKMMENSVSVLEEEIQRLEDQFEGEKEIHEQNMEYDSLVSAILKLEDPEKQKKTLESMITECEILEDVNSKLDEKVKKKMMDFSLSFTALRQFN